MNVLENRDKRIQKLEERIAVLEQVCGEAYQLAGTVGAPEKALDNLAAAAAGEPIPHATFLPVSAADCHEFGLRSAAGRARHASAPKEPPLAP